MGTRKPSGKREPSTPFVRFDKPLFDALLLADFGGYAELKVALAMIRYTFGHRGHGEGNTMSVRFLAAKTELRVATVHRVVHALADAGFARVVGEPKGRRATRYAVVTDPAAWHFDGPRTRRRAPMRAATARLSAEVAAALRSHGGEHTVPMVGNTNGPLCSHGAIHPCTEERYEERSLKSEDVAASAEAASSSSPEPSPDDELSVVQRRAHEALARFLAEAEPATPELEVTPS